MQCLTLLLCRCLNLRTKEMGREGEKGEEKEGEKEEEKGEEGIVLSVQQTFTCDSHERIGLFGTELFTKGSSCFFRLHTAFKCSTHTTSRALPGCTNQIKDGTNQLRCSAVFAG